MNQTQSTQTLVCRKAGIPVTDLDGMLLMLNFDSGQYHTLNPVGTRIWQLLESPTTESALVSALTAEFEVTPEECAATVVDFLGELRRRGLLATPM